jgi:hypothetical protein
VKRIALHFPRLWKAALYAVLATSWLTGTTWFALHRWVRIEGDFGEEHSPWEAMLLKVHGASAMLVMVYFGYLLATHVPVGLRSKRNRLLGLTLVYAIGFMIVTAYGLYYLGGEGFRSIVSWAHTVVGFSLPLMLGLHVALGHRGNPANTKPLVLPRPRTSS